MKWSGCEMIGPNVRGNVCVCVCVCAECASRGWCVGVSHVGGVCVSHVGGGCVCRTWVVCVCVTLGWWVCVSHGGGGCVCHTWVVGVCVTRGWWVCVSHVGGWWVCARMIQNGMTPVMCAAQSGHAVCLQRLLEAGADPDVTAKSGQHLIVIIIIVTIVVIIVNIIIIIEFMFLREENRTARSDRDGW